MSRWNMILGGAVLWLTACGAPGVEDAVLETDHATYAPGAEVSLRLGNASYQALGYNLCFSTLQRHEGENWAAVPRPDTSPREFCAASQSSLEPGASTSSLRTLDASLPEGEYRYLTSVEWMWKGERMDVVSNAFRVVSPSTP
ncbi:hypothetical protein [Archangium sp.]|uniref:hypothetical protein n=1 Tax=Archangium sp. TaxID=1872627 RepID=UPI002EDB7D5A